MCAMNSECWEGNWVEDDGFTIFSLPNWRCACLNIWTMKTYRKIIYCNIFFTLLRECTWVDLIEFFFVLFIFFMFCCAMWMRQAYVFIWMKCKRFVVHFGRELVSAFSFWELQELYAFHFVVSCLQWNHYWISCFNISKGNVNVFVPLVVGFTTTRASWCFMF